MSDSVNFYGAVDLSVLAAKQEAQQRAEQRKAQAAASAAAGVPDPALQFIFEVTEESFQTEVVERSMHTPIILEITGGGQEVSALTDLVAQGGGAWLLGKVDAMANPRLVQALQVQALPTVIAIGKGQPVPLFQGSPDASQVQQVLTEVFRIFREQLGLTTAQLVDPTESEHSPIDPRFEQATAALDQGDFATARRIYQELLEQTPADAELQVALRQVDLLERTATLDESVVRAAADDTTDIPAQLAAADLDFLSSDPYMALDRLLGVLPKVPKDQWEPIKTRLFEYFELLGNEDAQVTKARTKLASLLF